jgi:DNA-binding transcriptional regulator WhiA
MKTLLITTHIMLITIFSFHIQQNSTDLTALLSAYYDVKNALVNSDALTAASNAGQFIKANNSLELKTLPGGKMNAFIAIQKNLITDAERIRTAKDLTKQREYFATFSQDFYSLAQIVKLSGQPVYQQYCPMKKMYWLSSETSIKNPYYGNAMLSCGRITETINP